MTQQEHLALLEQKLAKCLEIARKKNNDYAGEAANIDAFNNFRVCQHFGVVTVEQGIFVRMTDKVSRIASLLSKEAEVADESIQDTLLDLANYSLILSNYLDSKKHED